MSNDEYIFDASSDEYTPKEGAGGTGAGVLPDGRHVVFISDVTCGRAQNANATPYVEATFTCHDPRSEHIGKVLRFQKYWLTQAAQKRYGMLCRSANKAAGKHNAMDQKQLDELLLERSLRIVVKTDLEKRDDGTVRKRIQARFTDPLSKEEAALLQKKWGADQYGNTVPDEHINLRALADGKKGAATGETFTDEEIPF